jgi:HEAT repeat protein
VKFLKEGAARSQDSSWLCLTLEALGNAGSKEGLDFIEASMKHEDTRVRASAAGALRFVNDPHALELLEKRMTEDAASEVRTSAVEAMAQHNTPVAKALLERALKDPSSVEVRRASLVAVGQRIVWDESARALVREVEANDPSPELRELAGQMLKEAAAGE